MVMWRPSFARAAICCRPAGNVSEPQACRFRLCEYVLVQIYRWREPRFSPHQHLYGLFPPPRKGRWAMKVVEPTLTEHLNAHFRWLLYTLGAHNRRALRLYALRLTTPGWQRDGSATCHAYRTWCASNYGTAPVISHRFVE